MYYTIYKVTNKVDGKYYIGKHQTKNLDDGYMGSGSLIKRAIKKHGLDNFTKEILHIFQTEEEMNAMEKEIVVLSEMSYNICEGGKGGFGYINANGLGVSDNQKLAARKQSIKNLIKINSEDFLWAKQKGGRAAASKGHLKLLWTGRKHKLETIKKMKQSAKGRIPWNKGKPWSEWYPQK